MFPTLYTPKNTLATWRPWFNFENELGRLLGTPQDWLPAVNVKETETQYTLEVEVPGLKKEDIQIEIQDKVLTLKGERKDEKECEEGGYRHIERRYGSFERSFAVPEGFNTEKVTAELKDGVLRVALPKLEEKKRKAVQVTVH